MKSIFVGIVMQFSSECSCLFRDIKVKCARNCSFVHLFVFMDEI
jgi:hypothetical protein